MNNESKFESFLSSQILGDGYVTKARSKGGSPRLYISHAVKYAEYLECKRNYLIDLGFPIKEIRTQKRMSSLGLQEICRFEFKFNAPYNKDPIENIYNLDSFGLLLWWCDDGCITVHHKKDGKSVSRFGYLNTHAFDLETNQMISEALFDRFDLKTAIHIDRGGILGKDSIYYRQYLNATNMRLLIDIVRPHIHKLPACMLYKLNMGYFTTQIKTSVEYSDKYNF